MTADTSAPLTRAASGAITGTLHTHPPAAADERAPGGHEGDDVSTTAPARVDHATAAAPVGSDPRAIATRPPGRLRRTIVFGSLSAGLVALLIVSAGTGQLWIPPDEILGSLSAHWNEVAAAVGAPWLSLPPGTMPTHPSGDATLWIVRFPRTVMAAVVGAALGIAGAVMQGVFRNPLAEPAVIGVSTGAAVGACLVIVFEFAFLGPLTGVVFAFAVGIVTTFLVYASARSGGRTEVVTIVLTGVAVNALGGAVIALLIFLGDTQQREQIVFWQLGSLNATRWQDVAIAFPIVVFGTIGCLLLARRLDLLALGERQAHHLGLNVEGLRVSAIALVALLTAAAVAMCGIIAFVGLVVPHVMRMLLGPGHRALLPASALGGAVLLVAADLLARTLVPYAELPIGMITALVGGPFFFWLLRRTRRTSGGWA